jgi:CDGSH-type Zn-finger protein
MARLVKIEATSPLAIEVGGQKKYICMCGLSQNQPFCDGSHTKCAGEEKGKLYIYENGKRREVKL